MHGFADASKQAYAAVIYFRVIRNSQVFVSLLVAKTRVAPLKTLSIPRLELCAAHLLARLASHIIGIIPVNLNSVHLWSDSTDVLCWLKDRPSRWPVSIANKCSEILTLVPNAFWHQVRSCDNPADIASRGIEPAKIENYHLWWQGPDWLVKASSAWSTTDKESAHPLGNGFSRALESRFLVPKNEAQCSYFHLIGPFS